MSTSRKRKRARTGKPRPRAARTLIIKPTLAALNALLVGERLKDALEEFKRRQMPHRTWDDVAESLEVDKKTLYRWFAGSNSRGTQQLHAIAELTGVSVDWLLGFTEARRRRGDITQFEAGVAIGSQLEQIEAESEERYVVSGFGDPEAIPWRKRLPPLPESSGELVRLAAESVFELRLGMLAQEFALKMRQLAMVMRGDVGSAQDRDERAELFRIASWLEFESIRLESSDSLLESFAYLELEEPLLTEGLSLTRRKRAPLKTPFKVWGRWGLAWRGPRDDHVWCIRPDRHKPGVLEVYARRRGRFLVPVE